MSKIEKLPDGIANGSNTYGDMCRPKGGRSISRATELKTRAAKRIADLMEYGTQADPMTKRTESITNKMQVDDLNFRNKLAELPKIVQFAYWRGRLEELRVELKDLEETENQRKIDFLSPTIKQQIKEVEIKMRELFDCIKNEKRVVKPQAEEE